MISPVVSGYFIDNVLQEPNESLIMKCILIYLLVALLQVFSSYILSLLSYILNSKTTYAFVADISKHIQKTSLNFVEMFDPTYISQRINDDCSKLVSFTLTSINSIIINILKLFICIVILWSVDYFLLFSVLLVIVLYFILFKFIRVRLVKINIKFKESSSNYFTAIKNQFVMNRLMRVFCSVNLFASLLEKRFNQCYANGIALTRTNYLFQSFDSFMSFFLQIILLAFGGYQIISGSMTVGTYVIISSYFSVLITSIKYFIGLGPSYLEAAASVDRINQILVSPVEQTGIEVLPSFSKISIIDLSFSYGNVEILKNISFSLSKGKVYQILGKNGKGKTTLLNILIGLYPDNFKGSIVFDNIDIRQLNMYQIRDNCIGIVSQEDFLIEGPILENITLQKGNYDYKLISKYYKLLFDKEFNPNETSWINPNASNFSGREKKKIEIIRCLSKRNTQLIILDEVSNSLDNRSKQILVDQLNELKNDKIIIVSHDNTFENIIDEYIDI